ncbi:hypothetical protein KY285_000749 [Solanum tuberosum]|nr:hypothetical protein KY285_000749 [Solanum tuberosum]
MTVITEVQPNTPIRMLDEKAPGPENSEVQLFDEYSPKDMSKRYVNANSLDHRFSNQKIEFETIDDMYLDEFFLEPETIEDLYLDNLFLEIEDSIPRSNMPSDVMLVKEDGKSTDEFSAHNILCITFKFKALIGTVNTKPPLLLGSNGTFGFIAYANSMNLVWDPRQQRFAYNMVVMESKVDNAYSEMNHVFDESFQRVASRIWGDKIDCHPTFSWYEFTALQTCEKDQWSLIVFENVLELVKVASIGVAYVVHKVMLNESKITFILVNCGKLTTTTKLICYPTHFGGNRRVEEHTIAQQLLESNPVLKSTSQCH